MSMSGLNKAFSSLLLLLLSLLDSTGFNQTVFKPTFCLSPALDLILTYMALKSLIDH